MTHGYGSGPSSEADRSYHWMDMRSDSITIGVLGLFVGMAIIPYAQLAFEWWLTRPKRIKQFDIYDHCKECNIK